MTLHKTDYGLVYNDDGSLCVTKRTDDVPFAGTTAWAVESGTTNAFQNVLFENGTTSWSTGGFDDNTQLSVISNEGLFNLNAMKVERIDGTRNGAGATMSQGIGTSITLTEGETVTVSWYVKGVGNTIGKTVRTHLYVKDGVNPTISTGSLYTLTDTWQRISHSVTWPYASTTTNIVCLPQIEKKPFATSFVDGTRSSGRLFIPHPVDFLTNNFVVSWWSKPIAGIFEDRTSITGITMGSTNSGYSYWHFGKADGFDRFRINLQNRGGGTVLEARSDYFNPNDFWEQWHYFVVTKDDDKTFKLYVDGILQVSLQFTDDFYPFLYPNIYFCSYNNNGTIYEGIEYFANLYIGKYRENGNVIWTDEYIKQVYDMKSSFFVPPRAIVH